MEIIVLIWCEHISKGGIENNVNLGYVRGKRIQQQIDFLGDSGVEEFFIDDTMSYDILYDSESNYQRLLDYAQVDDCIVIVSLEVLSRDYVQLLKYLDEIEELELELMILTSPNLTLIEWKEIINWVSRNDRLLHPRLIKLNLSKSQKLTRQDYPLLKGDKEAKELYWSMFWQLAGKNKVRQVAKKNGVPIETAYSVLQDFKRIKTAVILAMCFLFSIATIKLAETFSDNIFIQIIICVVTTLLILYNTLSDSEQI